jgi:hypothetical protein
MLHADFCLRTTLDIDDRLRLAAKPERRGRKPE